MTDKEKICDLNGLYHSLMASKKGSYFKTRVQEICLNYLEELCVLKEELETQKYKGSKGSYFSLNERGHERYVRSSPVRDRVVRHSYCDYILSDAMEPYLYWDNGASQVGKGLDFTRGNFEGNVHSYYRAAHSNKGWIGFGDFSRYYDNILHSECKRQVGGILHNDPDMFSLWLLDTILRDSQVDVSYMSDEEFSRCMEEKFDSIAHSHIDISLLTGKRFMEKSLSIGDQTSQNLSVFYPTRIDNYVKTVRGVKLYGRYMDDFYIIHEDKDFIRSVLEGVSKEASDLGIFMNMKKMRILPLSGSFTYLQRRYRLTSTGKLIRRVSKSRVTSMRRKLKKYRNLERRGDMTYGEILNAYQSWLGNHYRFMSRQQRGNLNTLFDELFIESFKRGEYEYG